MLKPLLSQFENAELVMMTSLCVRSAGFTIKIYGCHSDSGNIPHRTQYWGNWIHWWRDLSGSTFKQFILHQLQGRVPQVNLRAKQWELFGPNSEGNNCMLNVVQTVRQTVGVTSYYNRCSWQYLFTTFNIVKITPPAEHSVKIPAE